MPTLRFQDILSQYSNPVLIKRGGQKVVYKIDHPEYGTAVLKIGQASSRRGLERIRREVNMLRELDPAFYPRNYDFAIYPQNRFIIIEEFIESSPLSECFNRFDTPGKILIFLRELVVGLKKLWDKNAVHRDVKPDNILITPDTHLKIIDLGIARLLDLESLTYSFVPRGPCTPNYAAPEQLKNRKAKIDARTDQFSIGIVLMQLLLQGRHPFDPDIVGEGESIEHNILAGKWYKEILDNSNLQALRSLAIKLLGNEPFERYRQPDLLLNAIDQCMERYQ